MKYIEDKPYLQSPERPSGMALLWRIHGGSGYKLSLHWASDQTWGGR